MPFELRAFSSPEPDRHRPFHVNVRMAGSLFAAAFLLVFAALVSAQSAAPSPDVWTADDIVMGEQASSFQISPAGRHAVWVKTVPNRAKDRNVTVLMLATLADGRELQLTRGTDGVSDPKWSPDGRFVSFSTSRKGDDAGKDASDSQLWLIDPFGGEPWKITDLQREISDYVWADPDTIIFSAEESPTLFEITNEKDDTRVVEDEAHASPVRLFKFSIGSKKVTRLTDNTDRISYFYLSPDAARAVTVHSQSLTYSYDNRVKPLVFLYDLRAGTRKQIFDGPQFNIDDIVWAKDGTGFYASNDYKKDPRFLWAVLTELYYFDLAKAQPVKVDLGWENGLTGSFAATGDGFVAMLANGVRNKIARYYREGSKWRREWITGEHASNIFRFAIGRDDRTFVYNYSTASTPSQWNRATLDGTSIASPLRITDINKAQQQKQIARTEIIHWKGALDEQVEGILYYPQNYQPGKRYPLMVMIHGGPTLVDSDAWKETYHYPHNLYTSRGAFVFAPNYHGSSNYGQKWSESIGRGKYYDLEIPDIEKGVDHLIAKGLVDPEKLGTMGWSNGSLLSIELTTRTNRYKAAGAGAGTVEWTSDWATAYFGASFNNYYFGASPLDDPQTYVRKSPFYRLNQVRTPTIIFFGENDTTVAPSQGWLHFRALQQTAKTDVKFILFPGEGHSLRKLSHQRRKLNEELAWFEKYLFRNAEKKNEALKPGSPLAAAFKLLVIKRSGRTYGETVGGRLIPEFVVHEGIEVGRFEVTRAQFAAFDPTYKFASGTENFPANNISFDQAERYAAWLSQLTGAAYRLPDAAEADVLYSTGSADENTLDHWAGYKINPDDAARLSPLIAKLPGPAPLLKEVGSFNGTGDEQLVFDLGGNVAEWVTAGPARQPEVRGGSADMPVDPKIRTRQPAAEYIGFRLVRAVPARR